MPNERRYECTLLAGPYRRLKVNVFTPYQEKVQELARERAVEHLKRLLGMPAALLDMNMIHIDDCGECTFPIK
jgi:hypothetical protein